MTDTERLKRATEIWDALEDVCIDDCDCIDTDVTVPYLGVYEKGTNREDIWHDIEDTTGVAVTYLMFGGDVVDPFTGIWKD